MYVLSVKIKTAGAGIKRVPRRFYAYNLKLCLDRTEQKETPFDDDELSTGLQGYLRRALSSLEAKMYQNENKHPAS